MADRKYVGKGWGKTFDNGGTVINISLKLTDLQTLPVDDYGNIRLTVGQRREPDEKSKADCWVAVDEYRSQH